MMQPRENDKISINLLTHSILINSNFRKTFVLIDMGDTQFSGLEHLGD